jgi:ribosomal protein S6
MMVVVMAKKQRQDKPSNAKVTIPGNLDHPPEPHEVDAAWILAVHFDCEVEFLKESKGYMVKTPDIKMRGVFYEIKSPNGKSKSTISNNLNKAKEQSRNIILDLRRLKMSQNDALSEVEQYLSLQRGITRMLVITKDKKVLALKGVS